MYSAYPINDRVRPASMDPDKGTLYPEEQEVLDWIAGSEYRFGDLDPEAGYDWRTWNEWAVPVGYIYEDYRKWKRCHLYNPHDPDAPHLLTPAQFGIVLRKLMPAINNDEGRGDIGNRRCLIQRICTRTGDRKNMRALRGVKHPDAYPVHTYPGRPRNDRTLPPQD